MPRAELNVIATVTDQASSQLQRLRGEVWMLSRVAEQGAQGLTRYDVAMSGLMAGGMLSAFALGIAGVAKAGVAYNNKIMEVINNTTVLQNRMGEADAIVKRVGDNVLKMSVQFGAASDQIAMGWMHAYNLVSDMNIADLITEIGTKSAVANFANVEATVNILANTMHAYGLDTSKAGSEVARLADIQYKALVVMGQMDRAAAAGNMTVEEFNRAAGRSIAVGANLKIPLEQVAAAFVALTKHGYSAAQAQTQVTNLMQRLANPTKAALKEIKALSAASGVDLVRVFTAQYLAQHGLAGALQEIQRAYKAMGYSQAQATQESYKLINAQRGGQALAVLLGTGVWDYNEALKMLSDREAMAAVNQDQFNEVTDRAGWQLGKAEITITAVAQALGEGMQPAIVAVMKPINALLDSVFNWVSANKTLAGTITLVIGVVAGVLGVLMTVGSTILLLTPIIKSAGAAWAYLTGQASGFAREGGQVQAATRAVEPSIRTGTIAVKSLGLAFLQTAQVAPILGKGIVSASNLVVGAVGTIGKAIGGTVNVQGLLRKGLAGLVGDLSKLAFSFNLQAKAVKSLSQAEIDELAIKKIVAVQTKAEAQAKELAALATRESTLAIKAEQESLRLSALSRRGYARSAELIAASTSQLVTSERAHAASAKLTEAATLAEAAALKAQEAATATGISATDRAVIVEEALTMERQAAARASEAYAMAQEAEARALSTVAATEAAVTSRMRTHGPVIRAVARETALHTQILSAETSVLAANTKTEATATMVDEAHTAVLRQESAAAKATWFELNFLNIVAKSLGATMLAASVGLRVLGVAMSVASTAAKLLGSGISLVIRLLEGIISAAVGAAKSLWGFITRESEGAAIAREYAAAQAAANKEMLGAGEAAVVSGQKTAGIFGALGGILGKLMGPLLTILLFAPMIADAYNSNFLGIKSLLDNIFGEKPAAAKVDTSKMTKKQLAEYKARLKKEQDEHAKWVVNEAKLDAEAAKNPLGAFAINRAWEKAKRTIDSVIAPNSPLRGIWDWIKVAGDKAIPFILSAFNTFGKALTTVRGVITTVISALGPPLTALWNFIASFAKPLSWLFDILGNGWSAALSQMSLASWLGDLIGDPSAAYAIVGFIANIGEGFKLLGTFLDALRGPGAVADKVLSRLPEWLQPIAKIVGGVIKVFGDLTYHLGRLLQGKETLGDFFKAMGASIARWAPVIWDGIATLFRMIPWDKIWAWVQKAAVDTFHWGLGLVGKVWNWLVGVFKSIDWPGVWSFVSTIASNTFTWVVNAGKAVFEWLKGLWGGIEWDKVWKALGTAAEDTFYFAFVIYRQVESWLADQFSGIEWNNVWDAVRVVGDWASGLWDKLFSAGHLEAPSRKMGGIVLGEDEMVTVDEGIGHKVITWLQSIWPSAETWKNEIWPSVGKAAQEGFNWVVNVTSALGTWLGQQLGGIDWKSVSATAGDWIGKLWDAIFAPVGYTYEYPNGGPEIDFGKTVKVTGGLVPRLLEKLDEALWDLSQKINGDPNAIPGAKASGQALMDAILGQFKAPGPGAAAGSGWQAMVGVGNSLGQAFLQGICDAIAQGPSPSLANAAAKGMINMFIDMLGGSAIAEGIVLQMFPSMAVLTAEVIAERQKRAQKNEITNPYIAPKYPAPATGPNQTVIPTYPYFTSTPQSQAAAAKAAQDDANAYLTSVSNVLGPNSLPKVMTETQTFWETVGNWMIPSAELLGTKTWDAFLAAFTSAMTGVTASALDEPWIVNADGTFGSPRSGGGSDSGSGSTMPSKTSGLPIFLNVNTTPQPSAVQEVTLSFNITQNITGSPGDSEDWQVEVIETLRQAVAPYAQVGPFAG